MADNEIEADVKRTAVQEDNQPVKTQIEVGREHIHRAVRPHETYEGGHRFDPDATWTAEEERRVVRKTDLILLPWLCLMVRYHQSF